MGSCDPIFLSCFLIVALPLLSFAVIMIFTWRRHKLSLSISLTCSTIPLILAWSLFYKLHNAVTLAKPIITQVNWLVSDAVIVPFGFLLDPVSLLMLCIVATIAWLIQIYSIGYMEGDPGFARFYADLSLFGMSMLSLVSASGMLQLFISWELVGLASYLLIGFWYEKFSASEAGKKAFVVTRFGDIGFFMGLVFLTFFMKDLNIPGLGIFDINGAALTHKLSEAQVTLCALLIFCGVAGKSAQFPIHVWLPDAMEGPTPVSALLHSATMVAAGIYLITRLFPLFAASATAMSVVLVISTITLLLSSTIGMVAKDIKQVWAYSTVSQLGFMAMGLSAAALGGSTLFAGYYHLTTHAAFKALLFLCAGVFIHHFGTNDFFVMSKDGGRKLMIPMVTVTIGALALAGIFPFAGFFSKEAIMAQLWHLPNKLWVGLGLFGAFLTAYYTFRVIFVMLFPRKDDNPVWKEYYVREPGGHGHGAHDDDHDGHNGNHGVPWVMAFPLIVLAAFACVLGFMQTGLEKFLLGESHPHEMNYLLLVLAVGSALSGIGLAWLDWGSPAAKWQGFIRKVPVLENFFIQKWYMDHFWRWFLNTVIYGTFSRIFTYNDRRVVDGGVDAVAFSTIGSGRLLSFLQTAFVQLNLLFMVLVLAGVGLYLLMGR
ncbi:MAG: NADH-quinone oxidoreductase subunit L [Syntrophales bacterium]|nr:NADH-quinone oxidoreductase subunit L [Syntrophales bacterium]MDD5641689.1 NADH-quinone oxidoreductase subunit L [Syntrophales bacterium]